MEDRQRERQRQPCRDEPPRRRNEQPNRRSQARQPCRRTSPIAQARMVTMSESAAEVRTEVRPLASALRWRKSRRRSPKACAIVQLEDSARHCKRMYATRVSSERTCPRRRHRPRRATHRPDDLGPFHRTRRTYRRHGPWSNDMDGSNESDSSIRHNCADPLAETDGAGGAGKSHRHVPHCDVPHCDQRLGATRRAYWSWPIQPVNEASLALMNSTWAQPSLNASTPTTSFLTT